MVSALLPVCVIKIPARLDKYQDTSSSNQHLIIVFSTYIPFAHPQIAQERTPEDTREYSLRRSGPTNRPKRLPPCNPGSKYSVRAFLLTPDYLLVGFIVVN